MKELEYPFDSNYIITHKKRIRRELIGKICPNSNDLPMDDILGGGKTRIAFLGGSTTDDIVLITELFLLNLGIVTVFYQSEYNKYYEESVFFNKKLLDFCPDIIYIHTSFCNITKLPAISDTPEQIENLIKYEEDKFITIWTKLAETYNCPIIQNNFELPPYRLLGNKDASDIHGAVNFVNRLNAIFYNYAQNHNNFFICDINYLSADYGLKEWSDPFYYYMYKYSLAVPAIPYLAHNLANIIKSIFGKNKKGFVLDLDNTLWGGTVGDDGADRIAIGSETPEGETYTEFQKYIKLHKNLGILLTINSKNDKINAINGLNHKDSILKPEDFAVIKANWQPKDNNFSEIASELNLLPDSLVFIDDNSFEREIVRRSFPDTNVPELSESKDYIRIIDRSGFFESTIISSDDFKRNEMYSENAKRKEYQSTFNDYNDYLVSLKMIAYISPFDNSSIERIAQLTNKTNQFNLTTVRCTANEIEKIRDSSNYITLYGRLVDKFGDNGIIAVVFGHIDDKNASVFNIDLWLMSCRILKRGMEYAMMDVLVEKCRKRNISEIYGYYYHTPKNGMVKDFYGSMGFDKVSEEDNGNSIWRLNLNTYTKKNNLINLSNSNE